jgi:hypothetical protein
MDLKRIKIIYCILLLILHYTILYGQIAKVPLDTIKENKHDYPRYIAFVGLENKINKGVIKKNNLTVQLGINCLYVCSTYQAPCRVSSYKLLIISNNQVIYRKIEVSGFFSKDIKNQFNKLKPGDMLIIYDINVSYPLGTEQAPSIVYKII